MKLSFPESWERKQLNDVIEFVTGGDWGKDPNHEDEAFELAYCIRGSEIKNWEIEKGKTASLRKVKRSSVSTRRLQLGDILVEISGGGPEQPVGRTVMIDNEVLFFEPDIPKICTNFLRLVRPTKEVNSSFLNLFLKLIYTSGEVVNFQGGSNNLRNLKFGDYAKIEIPLPPLAEQERIVAEIETLFSELDAGKAELQKAAQQLKTYRQAVLKFAFEGRLTNDAVVDGELPEGWKWAKIEDIATVGTGATPLKSKKDFYEEGRIAWVTSGALNDDFVREASSFVTEKALKETNLSIYPVGTLLLAMYGEGKTRGKCSELLIEATTNQAIAAIHFEKHDDSVKPFLKYFLLKNYNEIRMQSSGGVQPNLNLGIVKKTKLPLPPFEEQHRIVQEIEARLSVCDKMEETIVESLQQAEALRQSILKKAFEGRLPS